MTSAERSRDGENYRALRANGYVETRPCRCLFGKQIAIAASCPRL